MELTCGKKQININKIKSIGFYSDRVEIDLAKYDSPDYEKLKISYDDFSIFFVNLINEFNRIEND